MLNYSKQCPKCNKIMSYTRNYTLMCSIKHNWLCASCGQPDMSGQNNPMFGKKQSMESKRLMSRLGSKCSKDTKLKMSMKHCGSNNAMFGKTQSSEAKKKMRISKLNRFELLGIPCCQDKNSPQWFDTYNKANNTNFRPKRFMDIGYDADGYDENNHIWIEYDTQYHLSHKQTKKDKVRQNNIIEHFETIGEPLNEFKRFTTWDNKLTTVYKGYQYA